jgi:DNA-binding MarR family transcriptional regulator
MYADQPWGDNLLFEMFNCARLVRKHLETRLAAHYDGLTFGDAQALAAIATEQPMQQGRVAARLLINRPAATETINRLERLGLVERRHEPADLRMIYIDVTDKGTDVFNAIFAEISSMEVALHANLTSTEQKELRSSLLEMRKRLILNRDD